MIKFFKVNIEPNKRLRMIEVIFSIGLCIGFNYINWIWLA